jgi:hypothetical protein
VCDAFLERYSPDTLIVERLERQIIRKYVLIWPVYIEHLSIPHWDLFCLYRILFYSSFVLDRFHCIRPSLSVCNIYYSWCKPICNSSPMSIYWNIKWRKQMNNSIIILEICLNIKRPIKSLLVCKLVDTISSEPCRDHLDMKMQTTIVCPRRIYLAGASKQFSAIPRLCVL